MHTEEEATGFVDTFLATDYSGEERHTRRIEMLTGYEETGELPPLPFLILGPRLSVRVAAGPAAVGRSRGLETSRARIDRPMPTTAGVGAPLRPFRPPVTPIRGIMPEGHTLHRLANDVWDAFGGRSSRPPARRAGSSRAPRC